MAMIQELTTKQFGGIAPFKHLLLPLIHSPDKIKLYTHVELVYTFISPFYWIWSSRKMLLLLEPAFVALGGIAIYLLAKKKGLKELPSLGVLISYLGFYGVQNAIRFDVHSISFGAAFLAWFLYFLDGKKLLRTAIFFFLAITAKENFAFITFFISLVYFIKRKDKLNLLLALFSLAYIYFVFFYILSPHSSFLLFISKQRRVVL